MYYTLSAGKNSEDRSSIRMDYSTRHLISMVCLIKWLLASENELLALLNMMCGEWRVPLLSPLINLKFTKHSGAEMT